MRFYDVLCVQHDAYHRFTAVLILSLVMQVIAYACVACLLSMNMILVFTISFYVIKSASAVFPACQHGFVGSCLAESLPISTLKKIHKFYLAGEKRLAIIEDEDAAMQNVLQEELGGDPASDSEDSPPPSCNTKSCERSGENYLGRKTYISFADSVGEILRQKMQICSSNAPAASVNFSGD